MASMLWGTGCQQGVVTSVCSCILKDPSPIHVIQHSLRAFTSMFLHFWLPYSYSQWSNTSVLLTPFSLQLYDPTLAHIFLGLSLNIPTLRCPNTSIYVPTMLSSTPGFPTPLTIQHMYLCSITSMFVHLSLHPYVTKYLSTNTCKEIAL